MFIRNISLLRKVYEDLVKNQETEEGGNLGINLDVLIYLLVDLSVSMKIPVLI